MNWMLITNKVDIACHAVSCHVARLFIDLEILGKYERQGHLDTVISDHSISDIGKMRQMLPNAEILVRINPVNPETAQEVEKVIKQGADIIMLPMFQSKEDIESVGKMIDGRVKFIPLIETKAAAENLKSYVTSPYITEFYIGLNDLHRELGHKFMFELISTGYVEKMVNDIKHVNKPFGFGGIARIGEGTLPAKLILAEHVRLGSSAVILSRAFHQRSESLDELKSKLDLAEEIEKLNSEFEYLKTRTSEQEAMDKKLFGQAVEKIVAGME